MLFWRNRAIYKCSSALSPLKCFFKGQSWFFLAFTDKIQRNMDKAEKNTKNMRFSRIYGSSEEFFAN
jgi:hypothetical protein